RGDGGTRYRLLETIRQYARAKLVASGDADLSLDRHLNYFGQWAEQAEPHLIGAKQLTWLARFEAEHDNLRTALDWSQTSESRAEQGLRLVAAAARFWRLRAHLSEGRMRVTAALSHPGAHNPQCAEARARALFWGANLAYLQSDYPATRSYCE